MVSGLLLLLGSFVGAAMNRLAAGANGGRMPVVGRLIVSDRHQPMTSRTRLRFLCDVIPFGRRHASLGDAVMLFAATALVFRAVVAFVGEIA